MNIANLNRIYHHIKGKVPAKKLNLSYFRLNEEDNKTMECNTVGCIIGNSIVLAPDLVTYNDNGDINFYTWSNNFLELNRCNSKDRKIWHFLFNCKWGWEGCTNSKAQALKRIKFVIDHKDTPNDWWEQQFDYKLK
jgi:hypothetical protein